MNRRSVSTWYTGTLLFTESENCPAEGWCPTVKLLHRRSTRSGSEDHCAHFMNQVRESIQPDFEIQSEQLYYWLHRNELMFSKWRKWRNSHVSLLDQSILRGTSDWAKAKVTAKHLLYRRHSKWITLNFPKVFWKRHRNTFVAFVFVQCERALPVGLYI